MVKAHCRNQEQVSLAVRGGIKETKSSELVASRRQPEESNFPGRVMTHEEE